MPATAARLTRLQQFECLPLCRVGVGLQGGSPQTSVLAAGKAAIHGPQAYKVEFPEPISSRFRKCVLFAFAPYRDSDIFGGFHFSIL